jgi:hypothetical protein
MRENWSFAPLGLIGFALLPTACAVELHSCAASRLKHWAWNLSGLKSPEVFSAIAARVNSCPPNYVLSGGGSPMVRASNVDNSLASGLPFGSFPKMGMTYCEHFARDRFDQE